MKLHSKWMYLCSGVNLGESFIFALAHQGIWVVLCLAGAMFNWYLAERRAEEERTNG